MGRGDPALAPSAIIVPPQRTAVLEAVSATRLAAYVRARAAARSIGVLIIPESDGVGLRMVLEHPSAGPCTGRVDPLSLACESCVSEVCDHAVTLTALLREGASLARIRALPYVRMQEPGCGYLEDHSSLLPFCAVALMPDGKKRLVLRGPGLTQQVRADISPGHVCGRCEADGCALVPLARALALISLIERPITETVRPALDARFAHGGAIGIFTGQRREPGWVMTRGERVPGGSARFTLMCGEIDLAEMTLPPASEACPWCRERPCGHDSLARSLG